MQRYKKERRLGEFSPLLGAVFWENGEKARGNREKNREKEEIEEIEEEKKRKG